MLIFTAAIALAAQTVAPPAERSEAPALTAQQAASVRCSAAFAMVAQGQANGDAAAQAYPAMAERGREYFVRSVARLMDELALDRPALEQLIAAEVQRLDAETQLAQVMPPCLALLDASGF